MPSSSPSPAATTSLSAFFPGQGRHGCVAQKPRRRLHGVAAEQPQHRAILPWRPVAIVATRPRAAASPRLATATRSQPRRRASPRPTGAAHRRTDLPWRPSSPAEARSCTASHASPSPSARQRSNVTPALQSACIVAAAVTSPLPGTTRPALDEPTGEQPKAPTFPYSSTVPSLSDRSSSRLARVRTTRHRRHRGPLRGRECTHEQHSSAWSPALTRAHTHPGHRTTRP